MTLKMRLFLAILTLTEFTGCKPTEHLPIETRIESTGVEPLAAALSLFANGLEGYVFAAQGSTLVRLNDGGRNIEPLAHFDDPIVGIYTTPTAQLLVSTDPNYWDSKFPCRVFISRDGAKTFELTKVIHGGCPLWWSFAASADGTLFMGEYGPKIGTLSKTVWRSRDNGRTWQAVFHAPLNDNAHVHRVTVDPYTGNVWVTIGDGSKNRGIYCSTDGGDTWSKMIESQATAVVFTEQGIYWGEDRAEGIIGFTLRSNNTTHTVLQISDRGHYGGSVYDLALGRSGRIYAPFMKYPDQDHIATLWSGLGKTWKLLLRLASRPGEGVNIPTIAGPDRDGWLYIGGYRIRDGS